VIPAPFLFASKVGYPQVMLWVALAAVSPVPTELGPAWADISRAEYAHHITTNVKIGTLGYDRTQNRLDFWARRVVTTLRGETVSWADTRTCATLRPALASMRAIPVPKFAPIGSPGGPPVILDGIGYSLRSYSDEGTLTAETNLGTPLAAWIDQTLGVLEGCWHSTLPKRTDAQSSSS
jgi:hypothetical protein